MIRKILVPCSLFILATSCDQFFPSLGEMNKKIDQLNETQQTLHGKVDAIEKKLQGPMNTNTPNPDRVYNVEVGDSFVYGNKNAPVTLIKWLDFQCPYCAQSVPLVDAIMKKYPNDVKIVFKNFPLEFHQEAQKASEYVLAAEKQGKFLEMYHAIYDDYKNLKNNKDYPLEIAKKIGLDVEKLKQDLNDPSIQARIAKEVNELRNSGMQRLSVPKFLINGREPRGRNLELWSQMIDAEIAKSKGISEAKTQL